MQLSFEVALKEIKAKFPQKKAHVQGFYAYEAQKSGKELHVYIRDLKAQIKERAKKEETVRILCREKYGKRKYKISFGMVHVYGVMPNTNLTNWYLLGDLDTALLYLS